MYSEPKEWEQAPEQFFLVGPHPGVLLPRAPSFFRYLAAANFPLLLVPGHSEAAVNFLFEALFIVSLQVLPLLC